MTVISLPDMSFNPRWGSGAIYSRTKSSILCDGRWMGRVRQSEKCARKGKNKKSRFLKKMNAYMV